MPRPVPVPAGELVAAILRLREADTVEATARLLFIQRAHRVEQLTTPWERWPEDLKESWRRDAAEILDMLIDRAGGDDG